MGQRTLTTPDFIEDPDFIPPDEDTSLRSPMMPRMRNGQPILSGVPDPISGLQGEGDNTGLTVARQPTFSDRIGQRMDQNLRQVPEAVLRSLSGHGTAADRNMGEGIRDNTVGSDSDSAITRLSKIGTIGPRMVIDAVKGAVSDPASAAGDIMSAVVGEGAMGGGNGSGARSAVPEVEAEAGASSKVSGQGRSGPGGMGNRTRTTVPSGTAESTLSKATSLLKKGGLGSDIASFVVGHRGGKLLDIFSNLAKGKEPVAAAEAPLPHAGAGKGVFGSRVDQWGRTIPEQAPLQRTPVWAGKDTSGTPVESILSRESTSSGPGRSVFPSGKDVGAPFPRRPSWQSLPNVDVSEGGHSVQNTVADQASTAGQQGSADRVATEVQMSPAPQRLVRRAGFNPDPTSAKVPSAIPSQEYDPNVGVGPKEQDSGAKVRAEKPPMSREKRVRVRTPEEQENTQYWKQARAELGGESVPVGGTVGGKSQHSGVGSVSSATTEQIEARVNELKSQSAAAKLKKGPASVTKVPSSGVKSVGDINPHPRKYYPENEDSVPDTMVDALTKLKRRR